MSISNQALRLGHHREYTTAELCDLLRWSGFTVSAVDIHNYSLSLREGSLLDRLYVLAVYVWPTLLFRNCRELIMATAQRRCGGAVTGPATLSLLDSA